MTQPVTKEFTGNDSAYDVHVDIEVHFERERERERERDRERERERSAVFRICLKQRCPPRGCFLDLYRGRRT